MINVYEVIYTSRWGGPYGYALFTIKEVAEDMSTLLSHEEGILSTSVQPRLLNEQHAEPCETCHKLICMCIPF